VLKHREAQLLKQIEDLQKDCLRNLTDRQNEVNILRIESQSLPLKSLSVC